MNQKTAKRIRSIIGLQEGDPVTRRNYRGIKNEYNSLNNKDRKQFLLNLKKLFS